VLAIVVISWVHATVTRDLAAFDRSGDPDLSAWTIALGAGAPWLAWYVMLAILRRLSSGRYHPPVDAHGLAPRRAALFWVVSVTFCLIFTPVPLRISVGAPASTAASAEVVFP
jgi:hypothetical protein